MVELAPALDMNALISDLTPYQSPISPKQFGRLSCNLLLVAFIVLGWFIV